MAEEAEHNGSESAALEDAVDEAIAACGGDARDAVRALLVALDATGSQLEALKVEVTRVEAAVSDGYVRGRLGRKKQPSSG